MSHTASSNSSASLLPSLFAYKAWADDELLTLLCSVDVQAHGPVLHAATRILSHAHVVDGIFKAHLTGVPHTYAASNTPDTPTPQALAASVRALDAWFVNYATRLSPAALNERVAFTFTDGDRGRMTRHEMLLHLVTHGGYHRGQAGEVLRGASVSAPRDLYTRFLHATEPQRRSG